jgi:outer membrane protein assembly factor BamE (lipoprotein component of BamABCDE complex)
MKKRFAAALAAVVFAGCATTSHKVVDSDALSTLKPGVTTIAEVEASFGQPFQETKEPDGTDQLQYVSKVRMRDESTDHTTGSNIPKQIEKNISALLVFDQQGHFLHAWTADKTVDENVPGNLGKPQPNEVARGSMYSRGI